MQVSEEVIEAAAERIWLDLAAHPDWQTWAGRIESERVHKNDPSWGRMTDKCRAYARIVAPILIAEGHRLAREAVADEQLVFEPDTEDDRAYASAIDHALAAIDALGKDETK